MLSELAKATVFVRPCPFCGDTPIMERWHGGGPKKRMIHCVSVHCFVSPSCTGETPTAAARHWNERSAATSRESIELCVLTG